MIYLKEKYKIIILMLALFLSVGFTACSATREQYTINFASGEKYRYHEINIFIDDENKFNVVDINGCEEELVDIINSFEKTDDSYSENKNDIEYRINFKENEYIDIFSHKNGYTYAIFHTSDKRNSGVYKTSTNVSNEIKKIIKNN